ncbi:MAG: TonB family protein [Candidatus Krumholzibacteriia bacterium]
MIAGIYLHARELTAIRAGTRRATATSGLLHALLLTWLLVQRQLAPVPEPLVEIAWLEDPVPAAAPAPAVESLPVRRIEPEQATMTAPSPAARDARFERPVDVAATAPEPQDGRRERDAMRARLERLRESADDRPALAAAAAAPASHWLAAAPSSAPAPVAGKAPAELVRSGEKPAPQKLARGAEPVRRAPALAGARAPRQDAAPQPARTDPVTNTLPVPSGVQIEGDVANRPLVAHALPEYPAWATGDAVEADVTLRFVVMPDGQLKESIQVVRTAGFVDFDDAARVALARWRFAALPAGRTGDQSGTVTFRFRLRDQR